MIFGINRYIMECKFTLSSYSFAWNHGINRYIMECKYEQALDMWYRLVGELIDTLWNVNLSVHLTYLLSKSELIDTLWNVNLNAADVVQLKREN